MVRQAGERTVIVILSSLYARRPLGDLAEPGINLFHMRRESNRKYFPYQCQGIGPMGLGLELAGILGLYDTDTLLPTGSHRE